MIRSIESKVVLDSHFSTYHSTSLARVRLFKDTISVGEMRIKLSENPRIEMESYFVRKTRPGTRSLRYLHECPITRRTAFHFE